MRVSRCAWEYRRSDVEGQPTPSMNRMRRVRGRPELISAQLAAKRGHPHEPRQPGDDPVMVPTVVVGVAASAGVQAALRERYGRATAWFGGLVTAVLVAVIGGIVARQLGVTYRDESR